MRHFFIANSCTFQTSKCTARIWQILLKIVGGILLCFSSFCRVSRGFSQKAPPRVRLERLRQEKTHYLPVIAKYKFCSFEKGLTVEHSEWKWLLFMDVGYLFDITFIWQLFRSMTRLGSKVGWKLTWSQKCRKSEISLQNLMYIYQKQCEIMQKIQWNSSNGQLISHWFPVEMVHN